MLVNLKFNTLTPYNAIETIECNRCGTQIVRTIDTRANISDITIGPVTDWIYIQSFVKGENNYKYQDYTVDIDLCPDCIPIWIKSEIRFENTTQPFNEND